MRPVDLKNQKTDSANHNEKEIEELLNEFVNLRQRTLNSLIMLNEKEV